MSPHIPPLLLVFILACVSGCMPQAAGPSPRAVLVISSKEYSLEKVLEPLESLRFEFDSNIDKLHLVLDSKVDKLPETPNRLYELTYWYPRQGSKTYGVALVKHASDLKGFGAEEMAHRYFVEVYAQDKECALCNAVKTAFSRRHVSYFSACDNPDKSTEYEKIRCRPV